MALSPLLQPPPPPPCVPWRPLVGRLPTATGTNFARDFWTKHLSPELDGGFGPFHPVIPFLSERQTPMNVGHESLEWKAEGARKKHRLSSLGPVLHSYRTMYYSIRDYPQTT